jgi:hypothetical protein
MVDDRVVLEEQVLFETDRARVSSGGRQALAAVDRLCRQHPEWERLDVEGHADERGTAEYNQRLSEDRANSVRKVLLELGFDDQKVTAKGWGLTRPRAQGRDEESLRLNRRVELVVVRKKAVSGTGAAIESSPLPTGAPVGTPLLAPRAPVRPPRSVRPSDAAKPARPAAKPAAPAPQPAPAAAKPEPTPAEAQPPARPPTPRGKGKPSGNVLDTVDEGQ